VPARAAQQRRPLLSAELTLPELMIAMRPSAAPGNTEGLPPEFAACRADQSS